MILIHGKYQIHLKIKILRELAIVSQLKYTIYNKKKLLLFYFLFLIILKKKLIKFVYNLIFILFIIIINIILKKFNITLYF